MNYTVPDITKTAQADTSLAPDAATYNPTGQWDVTKDQTVQGQVQGIIASNSPLMQMAKTSALQQANAKGLANSSMAIGAGQMAMYNAALPMAQADAGTQANAAKYKADTTNQAAQFNASAQNQVNQFNTQQKNAQDQWNAGQLNDITKSKLEFENRTQLASMEANYKTLMQVNQSASDMYQQAIKNISDIQTSPDVTGAAKTTLINNQITLLNTGMALMEKMNGMTGLRGLFGTQNNG